MAVTQSVRKLVYELCLHLRMNPLASDSIEGISAWWLQTRDSEEADLLQALEWLQRGGVIESQSAADGRIRYRRQDPFSDIEAEVERLMRAEE